MRVNKTKKRRFLLTGFIVFTLILLALHELYGSHRYDILLWGLGYMAGIAAAELKH